ncbi:hypothetical protein [Roseovarius sp. MBR-78]|uniref:hypothetical protein n=1 Tax=Roseovarius sp. MBR-78 TaxID=3156460 RepID=UPI0033959015
MKFFLTLATLSFVISTRSFAAVGACPISADFVTQPETFETTQQIGDYKVTSTTMRAFVDGAMVQIECTGMDPDKIFPNTDDATILTNYARFWSIQQTSPVFSDNKPVQHYAIEGVKDIQGFEVKYTYRFFRFSDSFAMVATGVPGGRPTADVMRFLTSLSLESSAAPAPFTEFELEEGRRNHMAACLPAIRTDNEVRQLGLSDVEITYFCSCTGQKYFAEFTPLELRTLALGNDASLENKRLTIQTQCFEDATR